MCDGKKKKKIGARRFTAGIKHRTLTILNMIIMKNIIIVMMIISIIKRIPPHPEGYCRHQPWNNVRLDDHST